MDARREHLPPVRKKVWFPLDFWLPPISPSPPFSAITCCKMYFTNCSSLINEEPACYLLIIQGNISPFMPSLVELCPQSWVIHTGVLL